MKLSQMREVEKFVQEFQNMEPLDMINALRIEYLNLALIGYGVLLYANLKEEK